MMHVTEQEIDEWYRANYPHSITYKRDEVRSMLLAEKEAE